MLDSTRLADRKVVVLGVFTDKPQHRGVAFGEKGDKLLALLNAM
jgi:hypothetical protein